MTSSSESNSATDSAPPSSGSSSVTGVTSANGLNSPSACEVTSSDFYGSPESEGRCRCCTKCPMDSKVATPDVCESPKSSEESSSMATFHHVPPTQRPLSAKRARDECGADDTFQNSNKKKKKFRSILKGMMSPSLKPVNVDKERDALRRGLGGGNFEKVAKI
mmetsp:Transcript_17323/g.35119  ORF Transcript_17323/g.35119 Transcript_17323/m.35119 type:complete len:163 (-) Transcript_17323:53-541(-)